MAGAPWKLLSQGMTFLRAPETSREASGLRGTQAEGPGELGLAQGAQLRLPDHQLQRKAGGWSSHSQPSIL